MIFRLLFLESGLKSFSIELNEFRDLLQTESVRPVSESPEVGDRAVAGR